MIFGIGHDQIAIERIEKSLNKFGDRFVNRVFTEIEQAKANKRGNQGNNTRASSYAKRFAAKEACAKALGTGIAGGIFWRDIEVINLPSGKPTIKLHNQALNYLQNKAGGRAININLTMSDDYPFATAIVIIELL